MSKKFWTIDKDGSEILRDLEAENEKFTLEKFHSGEFDGNNYMYHEMFSNFVYDDNGCDYERYGCFIKEGDVVLDIGGNIGIFAHRAEFRGASKVISFEPLTLTFNCLIKNRGQKTTVYKMAVGDKNGWVDFSIVDSLSNTGGGTYKNEVTNGRGILLTEKCYMININEIFTNLVEKIDFMKVDIEGGEVELFTAITDENLISLRCLSCEFHKINDDFDDFQEKFVQRMNKLGFRSFVLYLGNGNLRTLNFWKE